MFKKLYINHIKTRLAKSIGELDAVNEFIKGINQVPFELVERNIELSGKIKKYKQILDNLQ